jgi:dUTP pyrophosphatase
MVLILSGADVASLVRQVVIEDSTDQSQPAGYDLTVSRVFLYPNDEFNLLKSKRGGKPLNSFTEIHFDRNNFVNLEKGAYLLEFNEVTSIPQNSIGILFPRSTLLRNGLDLRTALFDPGYSGQPKAMLVCYRKAKIEKFARVGQLVIIQNEKIFSGYKGQYQNEGNTNKN